MRLSGIGDRDTSRRNDDNDTAYHASWRNLLDHLVTVKRFRRRKGQLGLPPRSSGQLISYLLRRGMLPTSARRTDCPQPTELEAFDLELIFAPAPFFTTKRWFHRLASRGIFGPILVAPQKPRPDHAAVR